MSDNGAQEHGAQKEVFSKPKIEVASTVMANPQHPDYSEDRGVAVEMAAGKSGAIAAIDGMGGGGPRSVEAAQLVSENIRTLETSFIQPPTINEAAIQLKNNIFGAKEGINKLQEETGNTNTDTTVSAAVLCESPDGNRKFLVTANVGDSRIYRYRPSSGEVQALTTDHSLVESLVKAGQITEDEAFTHPQRNQIYRSVGDLKAPKFIDIGVHEVQEGDLYLAVSDGLSDNLTPEGLPEAVRQEYREAYDPQTKSADMKRFTAGVAQRAHNVMVGTDAPHKKPDDVTVAAMRIPKK